MHLQEKREITTIQYTIFVWISLNVSPIRVSILRSNRSTWNGNHPKPTTVKSISTFKCGIPPLKKNSITNNNYHKIVMVCVLAIYKLSKLRAI